MFGFYINIKREISNYSFNNRRPEITGYEIAQLHSYKNAPQNYREDFDDSILGGLSRGVTKPKTLAKTLNSPFQSFFSGNDESLITEPNVYQPQTNSNIDSLIA